MAPEFWKRFYDISSVRGWCSRKMRRRAGGVHPQHGRHPGISLYLVLKSFLPAVSSVNRVAHFGR